MRKTVVEVKKVSKRIKENFVLKDIDLTIYENEIFGIIGPDGAGKTTLLRVLSGVLLPDSGEVSILNNDILKNPELIKDKIGVVPQNFSLYGDLTVNENLEFFAKMYNVDRDKFEKRRSRLLEITNLKQFLNRRAQHLSGGMQKKLAVTISIIHIPDLLILDEPTTGIDPLSRRELWDFFYELLGENITIIISTPYIDEMERCTKIGFFYNGRLLIVDEPENILSKYPGKNFEEIFALLINKYESD